MMPKKLTALLGSALAKIHEICTLLQQCLAQVACTGKRPSLATLSTLMPMKAR